MSGPLWEEFVARYREVRGDFDFYIDAMYLAAETDLNGVLLNRLGKRKHIDARSLFYGPFSRVEAYASEELYAWFGESPNRRMTWEAYEKSVVG